MATIQSWCSRAAATSEGSMLGMVTLALEAMNVRFDLTLSSSAKQPWLYCILNPSPDLLERIKRLRAAVERKLRHVGARGPGRVAADEAIDDRFVGADRGVYA